MANFDRVFNFSAGPSMLPLEVLHRAAAEITNYNGSGMSVMEMSHRSKAFQQIFDDTQAKFRRLMNIPQNYKILFMQGGASHQFSMVPLNLMGKTGKADYANTGNFSNLALKEAQKFGQVTVAASSADKNHSYIPTQAELKLSPDAAYFHYCANNTICGTEWQYVPDTGSVPLICDMSSNIMSRQVDISRYDIIYAGAQKNLAPAGLTIVILREDLPLYPFPYTPVMMDYQAIVKGDSMYNTPPCWCIYILGLVCDWVEAQGGVPGLEAFKAKKAQMLYDVLDASQLFHCPAQPGSRSDMNVTFRSDNEALDDLFVKEAAAAGLTTLKGHRSVGGMRASIYNAMPIEGVEKLCEFIRAFERAH